MSEATYRDRNFVFVSLVVDLLGYLSLSVGVVGHEGSLIVVVLNGLRLPRRVAWRIQ